MKEHPQSLEMRIGAFCDSSQIYVLGVGEGVIKGQGRLFDAEERRKSN